MVLAAVRPRGWARVGVVRGDWVVDVEEDAGLSAVIDTGNGNRVSRCARSGALDLQLRTTNVELRSTLGGGTVQSDVLGAHQVLSRGQILGQSEGEVVDSAIDVGCPLEALVSNGRGSQGVNLEPITGALVVLCRSRVWGLAHVHMQRSRVTNFSVNGEPDAVSSGDSVGGSLGHNVRIQTSGIANEVVGGHVRDRAVRVGRLADVFVGARHIVVDDECFEIVVCQGG